MTGKWGEHSLAKPSKRSTQPQHSLLSAITSSCHHAATQDKTKTIPRNRNAAKRKRRWFDSWLIRLRYVPWFGNWKSGDTYPLLMNFHWFFFSINQQHVRNRMSSEICVLIWFPILIWVIQIHNSFLCFLCELGVGCKVFTSTSISDQAIGTETRTYFLLCLCCWLREDIGVDLPHRQE